MKTSELSAAKNYNAELVEDTVCATINGITQEEFKKENGTSEMKWVLSFSDQDRGCVLNGERTEQLEDIHGFDTDGWMGKQVELYKGTTKYAGKTVDCVAIRKPEAPF